MSVLTERQRGLIALALESAVERWDRYSTETLAGRGLQDAFAEQSREARDLLRLFGNGIVVEVVPDDSDDSDDYPPRCTNPAGHSWPRVEEHERCLCTYCGADGDA